MNEIKNEEWNDNHNKKKGIIVLIATLLVIFLIVIGVVIYSWFSIKPKQVFTTAIDKLEFLVEKQEERQINNGEIQLKTNLESTNSDLSKILKIINNVDLSINYQMDYEEKKMEMELDSKYKKKELINLKMFIENNNSYIYLKNIYPKFLKIETNGLEQAFKKVEANDRKIMIQYFQKALKKALKEEYFETKDVTMEIQGKKTKVIKNNLLLDLDNMEEIKNTILEELDQEEFIKVLSKMTDNKETDIKEKIQEAKTQKIEIENEFVITIFTEKIKNSFIGFEIKDLNSNLKIIKNKEKEHEYEYFWDTATSEINGTLQIEEKEKEINLAITLNASALKGNVEFKLSETNPKKFETIDYANVIDENQLTEEEQELIMYNLQNTDGIKELTEEFMKYFF